MENTEITLILLGVCIVIAALALFLSFGKKKTQDTH